MIRQLPSSAPDKTPEPLRLALITDLHFSNKPEWRVPFPGNDYIPKKRFELIWASLCARKSDLILCPGDLIDRGDTESYSPLDRLINGSGNSTPFYPTIGNHDRTQSLLDNIGIGAFVDTCDDDRKFHYVVRTGKHHIIFLDSSPQVSDNPGLGGRGWVGGPGREWLVSVLQKVPPGEFAWIVTHYPPKRFIDHLTERSFMSDGDQVHEIVRQHSERIGGVLFGHVHRRGRYKVDGVTYHSIAPSSVALDFCTEKRVPIADPKGVIGFETLTLYDTGAWRRDLHEVDVSDSRVSS